MRFKIFLTIVFCLVQDFGLAFKFTEEQEGLFLRTLGLDSVPTVASAEPNSIQVNLD